MNLKRKKKLSDKIVRRSMKITSTLIESCFEQEEKSVRKKAVLLLHGLLFEIKWELGVERKRVGGGG